MYVLNSDHTKKTKLEFFASQLILYIIVYQTEACESNILAVLKTCLF